MKKQATIRQRLRIVLGWRTLRNSRKLPLLQTMAHRSPCKSVALRLESAPQPACRTPCRMTGPPREAIHILRRRCSCFLLNRGYLIFLSLWSGTLRALHRARSEGVQRNANPSLTTHVLVELASYLSPHALMSGSRVTNSFFAKTTSLSNPFIPNK